MTPRPPRSSTSTSSTSRRTSSGRRSTASPSVRRSSIAASTTRAPPTLSASRTSTRSSAWFASSATSDPISLGSDEEPGGKPPGSFLFRGSDQVFPGRRESSEPETVESIRKRRGRARALARIRSCSRFHTAGICRRTGAPRRKIDCLFTFGHWRWPIL